MAALSIDCLCGKVLACLGQQVNLLEEVIEQSVYSLGKYGESYSILTQCRKYIDQVRVVALHRRMPTRISALTLRDACLLS